MCLDEFKSTGSNQWKMNMPLRALSTALHSLEAIVCLHYTLVLCIPTRLIQATILYASAALFLQPLQKHAFKITRRSLNPQQGRYSHDLLSTPAAMGYIRGYTTVKSSPFIPLECLAKENNVDQGFAKHHAYAWIKQTAICMQDPLSTLIPPHTREVRIEWNNTMTHQNTSSLHIPRCNTYKKPIS